MESPVFLRIRCVLDLLLQLAKLAGDEAARAAGKVRHLFANPRLNHPRHEVGHGAGRVELARGTGALQLLENALVDFVEGVALLVVGQIQLVDDVDDLPQQHAVLHVLVGVREHRLHDGLFDGRLRRHPDALNERFPAGVLDVLALEYGKERVVDKAKQLVAGHGAAGLVIVRPVGPAAHLREDGHIALVVKRPVLLLRVVDLQKQHPRDLLDALCIAFDARVIAHDVAQPLDESGKITHYQLPSYQCLGFPTRCVYACMLSG